MIACNFAKSKVIIFCISYSALLPSQYVIISIWRFVYTLSFAMIISLPLIWTECLSSVGLEAEIWHVYSPASSGSAKEMTKVLPFSVSSNLTLLSSLLISWLPTATISLPFFQRRTKPSEIRERWMSSVCFGGMYKPRGQMRGRGVAQMTTTLNNSYLVKVST